MVLKRMISQVIFRKTISYKIIISFTLLIIIAITALLSFVTTIFRDYHISTLRKGMHNNTLLIENHLDDKIHKLELEVNQLSKLINQRITIIDFSGKVIADSEVDSIEKLDNHLYRPEIQKANNGTTGSAIRFSSSIKTEMLYYAKKSENLFIRTARPLEEVFLAIEHIRKIIIISGLVVLILCIFISYIISEKITSPIKESISFAEQFASGDYSHRILNYSENELGILQKSLNKLADNLNRFISKLMTEQNKLAITIESIEDAIVVINKKGKIIIANKSFKKLFSVYSNPQDHIYYEAIRSSNINEYIDKCFENKKSYSFEEELQDGEHCEIYIRPILDNNDLKSILLVLHDITEKKQIEIMKTDLVGNLSHELKTPLTIIKGYLETIELQLENKETCKEYISKALINVDRQNSIINDMLKLNKLETLNNFPTEKVSVVNIIKSCLEILLPKLQNKSISIEKKLIDPENVLYANQFLAEEIFFNLIDNAIIYNKPGGKIEINCEIIKINNKEFLTSSITDSGIGIPQDSLDRIFERFYRVDKGRSRVSGGTGLGLSIVKHAAEIMGWQINCKPSEKNTGTTFLVKIPI